MTPGDGAGSPASKGSPLTYAALQGMYEAELELLDIDDAEVNS